MAEELVRYFGRAAGRVQGVGFRFFVQQNAEALDITGWVRNMDDGTVTMELQGAPEQVDVLEQRIRAGNAFVKVRSLELEVMERKEGEKSFHIRY